MNHLKQGMTNYGPQTKSSLLPVFVNKVLREYNHGYLFTCLRLLQHCNSRGRTLQQRPYYLQSLKYFLSGSLQKKCADLWPKGKTLLTAELFSVWIDIKEFWRKKGALKMILCSHPHLKATERHSPLCRYLGNVSPFLKTIIWYHRIIH